MKTTTILGSNRNYVDYKMSDNSVTREFTIKPAKWADKRTSR